MRFITAALVAGLALGTWTHVSTAAEPPVLTSVRIFAKDGQNTLLRNTRITGSITSATNDFVELARLREVPPDGQWIELPVDAKGEVYRFLKIETPPNSHGGVAEIEFYAAGTRLNGQGFGTTGSRNDSGNTFDRALDGDTTTYFEGRNHDNQYVGLDLGDAVQVTPLVVSVAGGRHDAPVTVELSTPTDGAEIRYRLDGYAPGNGGQLYRGPITIDRSAVLHAVATKPGLARSVSAVVPYHIGAADIAAGTYVTFHIGNSLTDTVDGFLKPVMESAGVKHTFYRFTIPGAPTDWLWNHPGMGFGEVRYLESFVARAPITDILTQPFEGHDRSIENEAEHSLKFFDAARQHSPDIRPWLYSQWPVRTARGHWSEGTGANRGLDGVQPPNGDYTIAAENHLRYFEAVRDRINASWTGQPVRIIPTARAMALAKTTIEAGKVPGLTDFAEFYADDLHLTSKGRWFVANVVFACLTGQNPQGRVAPLNSGLNPEQADALQAIVWHAVTSYPGSGVKPAPTAP